MEWMFGVMCACAHHPPFIYPTSLRQNTEWRMKTMKKLFALVLVLMLAACAVAEGNYTDEMKIPYAVDLSPEGAASSAQP